MSNTHTFRSILRRVAALALAVSLTMSSFVASSQAEPQTVVVKALQGISIDVGATKVAGYYLVADGACSVTLLMGARPDADGNIAAGAARFEARVGAGRTYRAYTGDGQALRLTCGTGAKLLAVSKPDTAVAEVIR